MKGRQGRALVSMESGMQKQILTHCSGLYLNNRQLRAVQTDRVGSEMLLVPAVNGAPLTCPK